MLTLMRFRIAAFLAVGLLTARLAAQQQQTAPPVISRSAPIVEGISEDRLQPFKLPAGISMPGPNQYTITAQRPLAMAATILSQKLAVPISFEDALWAADADLMPMVSSIPFPPGFRPSPVPREHTFSFTLQSTPELRKAAAEPVIQSVIDSYHRSGGPGRFKVVRFGTNEFSIVAVSAADRSGKDTPQVSPLDKRISFPAMRRSRMDAIEEVRRLVSDGSVNLNVDSSGGVVSGNGFRNYLGNNTTDTGATNEPAREVLARIMGPIYAGNAKLAWVMLYPPQSKDPTLYLRDVTGEVTRPDGSQWLGTQVWTLDAPPR